MKTKQPTLREQINEIVGTSEGKRFDEITDELMQAFQEAIMSIIGEDEREEDPFHGTQVRQMNNETYNYGVLIRNRFRAEMKANTQTLLDNKKI